MSDEFPGIGALLRRAREKKGWSTQDVSSRLRLMSRQINAIEEEEFSKLGPPVFARGFVRNYAKLLGMEPDELLDQMTRIKTTKVPETPDVPFTPRNEFWKSPLVLGGGAAALLALAIPIGLYLWLSGDDEAPAVAPVIEQAVTPPAPPPAPPSEVQPQPEVQSQPEKPSAAPAQPPKTEAPAVPQAGAATQAPAFRPPPLPFPAPAPATQPAAPGQSSGPRLHFDESSWVQIRDSSGRIVHSGLNPAGSLVEVSGRPPFYLVVGNAEHVRLAYKGQTIDLKPFTAINVARLTLN